MLAGAARLAGLIGGALDPTYLRRSARITRTVLVAYVAAGLMVVIAMLFALIALFAGLTEVMPAWAAALVIAASAVLLAALSMMIGRRASRRLLLPPPMPLAGAAVDPTAAAAAILAPLVSEVTSATRRRPSETVLLAIAAGLITGRLLQRRKK